MKRLFLWLICLIAINQTNAQQSYNYTLNDLENTHYSQTFFNRLNLNPAEIKDSVNIAGSHLLSAISVGFIERTGINTILQSDIPNSGSKFGFVGDLFSVDDERMKKQSYELFYAHRFNFNNNIKLDAGIGLGFLTYKMRYQYLDENFDFLTAYESNYSVITNLGAKFQFYKNTVGISINDFWAYTDMEINGTINHKALANITLSYSRFFRLSRSLSLIPELALIKTEHNNTIAFNSVLDLNKRFQFGIYANTDEEIAFMFTGWMSEYFYMGLVFDPRYRKENTLTTIRIGFAIPGK